MQLEKEIMGERLTGFYRSLDNIIGTSSLYNKLKDESQIIFFEAKQAFEELDSITNILAKTLGEKNNMKNGYIELNEIKSDLMSQKEKLTKGFKERYTAMQKELNIMFEERERFKSKSDEFEKKFMDVSEEFKKLRHKMKQKYSSADDIEEKFCRNCQKSYFEKENFNWSCRIHASKLSGDTY